MMKMIKHTLFLPLAMMAALVLLASSPARAVVEIDINRANVEPLPIAITDFISNDEIGAQISAVVAADLKRSGLFAPIGTHLPTSSFRASSSSHGPKTGAAWPTSLPIPSMSG